MNRFEDLVHTARRDGGRAVASTASASCGRESQDGDARRRRRDHRRLPHLVVLHPALHRHARATSTPTPTASCSRCRCTAGTRSEGEAFVPAYLELLARRRVAQPRGARRRSSASTSTDPGFWDAGLDLVERPARAGRGGRRGGPGRARLARDAPGRGPTLGGVTDDRWLPPSTPAYEPPQPRAPRRTARPSGPPRRRRPARTAARAAGRPRARWWASSRASCCCCPRPSSWSRRARCWSRSPPTRSIWGWQFGVGFVLLLLVHEYGHVIQLRREGVKDVSAPVFIPFLGAAIWSKSLGRDAAAEARVGLAGPILGSLAALRRASACYAATGNNLFLRAGLHRILPEPVQPAAGGLPGRRARRGGAAARGSGCSACSGS